MVWSETGKVERNGLNKEKEKKMKKSGLLAILLILVLAISVALPMVFADDWQGEVDVSFSADGDEWSYSYQAIDGQESVWVGPGQYVPQSDDDTTAVYGAGFGEGDIESHLTITTGNSIDVKHDFEIDGTFDITYEGYSHWAEDTVVPLGNDGFVNMAQGNYVGDGSIDGYYETNAAPIVLVYQEGSGFGEVLMTQYGTAGQWSSYGPSVGSNAVSWVSTTNGYYNVEQSLTLRHRYGLEGDIDYFLISWHPGNKTAGFSYTQYHSAANPFQFEQTTDMRFIMGDAELYGANYSPVLEGRIGGVVYNATYIANSNLGVDFDLDITSGWLLTWNDFTMTVLPP